MLPRNLKVLLALSIGDGSVCFANGSWKFKCTHTEPQRAYALHKLKLLESVGYKPKVIEYVSKGGFKPGTNHIEVYFYHRDAGIIRNLLYPGGIKFLSPAILEELDAESLAYWYMDDGTVDTYNKTKSKDFWFIYDKRVVRSYKFSTNASTLEENRNMQCWLNSAFGIDSTISGGKLGYNLIISRIASKDKFLSLIEPFVIPSMRYKIKHPHSFNGITFTKIPRNATVA